MPVDTTKTGFPNIADPLTKLVVFPPTTAEHIFNINIWSKAAFTLNSLWIVTTRPLAQNALQLSFSTTFPSANDFPNHYIEVVFSNLAFTAIAIPFDRMGGTVPCSFSTAFGASVIGIQKPNCIVTYADKFH